MKFLLLIYTNEATDPKPGTPDGDAMYAGYGAFTQEVMGSGKFVSGEALMPVATAKTARVRNGEKLVTSGPFAETSEQLGGYYAVEADSIDEAVEWAMKIPGASRGCVEVRQVMEM